MDLRCDNHVHTFYSKDSNLWLVRPEPARKTLSKRFTGQAIHDDILEKVIKGIEEEDASRPYLMDILASIPLEDLPSAISITDHQTIDGYLGTTWKDQHGRTFNEPPFESLLEEFNTTLAPEHRISLSLGVELSLDVPVADRTEHFHFLFYYPSRPQETGRMASILKEGTLGQIMNHIIAQNNHRHELMIRKAARHENLSAADTKALIDIIMELKEPASELGREHIKMGLTAFFDKYSTDPGKLKTMFSRPGAHDHDTCCYVPLEEAGRGLHYKEALRELRAAYPLARIALAHPWRYDDTFWGADASKKKDGILLPGEDFIRGLAQNRLINALEVRGNFKIPSDMTKRSRGELIEGGIPEDVVTRIREQRTWSPYLQDHYAKLATKLELHPLAGNDSHGTSKPDIPVLSGCCGEEAVPRPRQGHRVTPARPIPAYGYRHK